MNCQNLEAVLDAPNSLRSLADDVTIAARERFRANPEAGKFALFFHAMVESLLIGRPAWPLQWFLAEAERTAWLIERACQVAAQPEVKRCSTSRALRSVVGPLWAECQALQAEGWHRPVAWDRRPTPCGVRS